MDGRDQSTRDIRVLNGAWADWGKLPWPPTKAEGPTAGRLQSGIKLSRPCTSQAHQYGIQQIQREAKSNFSNERSADPAFRGPVRSRVELFIFVRAGPGARQQIDGIDQFVEKPGVQRGFDVEVI